MKGLERECDFLHGIATFTRHEWRQARSILLASLLVLGIGLWPLIVTHPLYLDDMGRALDGYFGWNLNARPAAEGVMRLLGFGDVLVNVAPLPQLAAWAIAASMALVWWRALPGLSPGMCVLGNALVWLTPFTLQNFSYVFDSLPMSLALASAVSASLLLRACDSASCLQEGGKDTGQSPTRKRLWQRRLTATGLLVFALCSYQPALNAFLVLSLLEALFAISHQAGGIQSLWRRWRALLIRGGVALIALVVYLPLSRWLVAGDYSQQHGQMLSPGEPVALLQGVQHNLLRALEGWQGEFDHLTLVMSGGVLVVMLLLKMVPAPRPAQDQGKHQDSLAVRAGAGALAWASVAVWLALLVPSLWGPMLLLAEPVFHSRTLIAWGPLLGGALMLVATGRESLQRPSRLLMKALLVLAGLLLLRQWLIFAAWSNALNAQQQHERQLASAIVADAATLGLELQSPRLADSYNPQTPLLIQVLGEAPAAPMAELARQQIPAINRNLIEAFTPGNFWAVMRLRAAGASAVSLLRETDRRESLAATDPCASSPGATVAKTAPLLQYQLWQSSGVLVIDFRSMAQCVR